MRIKENKIKCKHCGSIVISRERNALIFCSCLRVGLEGGNDYLRRAGKKQDYIELTTFIEDKEQ